MNRASHENTAWITGAGGLIGSHLVKAASLYAPECQARPVTRQDLDLSDFAAVRELFRKEQPKLIIHCAALTSSPGCQANPALARKLNVEVTTLLADLAVEIPLIFFSSDLVFDGQTGNYDEAAPVNPLSVYAETKAAAEPLVLRNPRHMVIRTSLTCGTSPTGSRSLDEQTRYAWLSGQTLRLFTDEFRCPIPAEATARAVWELIGKNQSGLFHVAGAERLSRWHIGELLATRWPKLTARMQPTSLKDYQGAPRSPDTSLNSAKAQNLLAFPLPRFSDWVSVKSL